MEWQIKESDLKFLDKLGSGSCGEVHRVVWTKPDGTQLDAAAKKFKKSSKKKDSKSHTKELNLLRKLKHPNIVEFFCAVLSPVTIIVTEFAKNGSLFDYLKTHRSLPIHHVYDWALQATKAVQYIHDRDILHRDIKSGNFVISADNVLKLCDFGIAKNVVKTVCTDFELGTIPWMAPETFVELKLTKASDVYSLSIVIWEMLTGKIPYENRGFANIIWSVQIHKLRPDIPKSCPLALRLLLEQCWTEDANRRIKACDVACAIKNMQQGFKGPSSLSNNITSPVNSSSNVDKKAPMRKQSDVIVDMTPAQQMAKVSNGFVPVYNPPSFQSNLYSKPPSKDFVVVSFTDPSMSLPQKPGVVSGPTHILVNPSQIRHDKGRGWHIVMRYLQILSCLVVLGLVVCLLLHCSSGFGLTDGVDWMT